jgi:hypothetical protein
MIVRVFAYLPPLFVPLSNVVSMNELIGLLSQGAICFGKKVLYKRIGSHIRLTKQQPHAALPLYRDSGAHAFNADANSAY